MQKRLLYLAVLIVLAGCTKEHAVDCFKSNGSEVSETRLTGDFNTVEVSDKINLNVLKGSTYKVEVSAGRHIISYITTTIKNKVLILDNTGKCNFVRGYKREVTVTITVPYVKQIINKGVGTVYFDENYSQDSLNVRTESSGDIRVRGVYDQIKTFSDGNGDIYLEGACKSLSAFSNGTNFLHAEKLLVSKYIFVQTLSLGDCLVNASQSPVLEYDLWKTGNIYYSGTPSSIQNTGEGTGTGKVLKKD